MTKQGSDAVTEQIRDLENRRFKAAIDGDMKALEELYSNDLIYTHSSATVEDKKAYLEGIASKKYAYKRIVRPEETIRVFGDSAVVTGRAEIDVAVNGTDRHIVNRYIVVWVKQGGRWQAAAWQSTPIPPK